MKLTAVHGIKRNGGRDEKKLIKFVWSIVHCTKWFVTFTAKVYEHGRLLVWQIVDSEIQNSYIMRRRFK